MPKIDIIAHRGIHDVLPENSLGAFRAAWDAGLAWCECDVHLSADGVPVVLHDATLDRTTTGVGPIATRAWAELRDLHLRDAAGRVTREKIPSLRQAMDEMPAGRRMLIEIKLDLPDAAVRKLLEVLDPQRCMIQSFSPTIVRQVREMDPRFPTAWLLGEPDPATLVNVTASPAHAIHIEHTQVEKLLLAALRAAGKRVGVWTLNDPNRAIALRDRGVELFISDQPVALGKALTEAV